MEGKHFGSHENARTAFDWLLILGTTGLFIWLGFLARLPHIDISFTWATALVIAMMLLLITGGVALWRTTRFR